VVFGPSPNQFGHAGYGGSTGQADPDATLGVGYLANSNGGRYVNRRSRPLFQAIYSALGDTRSWEPRVNEER
jgi:CubicO group peptidase (beta-lactamase class C family)